MGVGSDLRRKPVGNSNTAYQGALQENASLRQGAAFGDGLQALFNSANQRSMQRPLIVPGTELRHLEG